MPTLIAPNLYQIPACKPACHCYLITGKKNALIDTGIREHRDYLSEMLAKLKLTFDQIDEVIYTHCHYDHTGGGEFFPNATVYAHLLCQSKLQYQEEQCIHALKYQVDLPTRIPDHLFTHQDLYKNGNYHFTVLHTPGHTDDSICLLEQNQRILISGDTIFSQGIPSLITDSGSDASLIASIELLSKYPINLILPGHGRIDTQPDLQKTKNNILKRIQKTNKKILMEAQQCSSLKY
ncbi:MAG: MBL fold metallo-hydrolase [Brevinema sp.]